MNATDTQAMRAEYVAAAARELAAIKCGDWQAADDAAADAAAIEKRAHAAGVNLNAAHEDNCTCAECWTGVPRVVYIDADADRLPTDDGGRPVHCIAFQHRINRRAPWADRVEPVAGGALCFESGDAWLTYKHRIEYMPELEARQLAIECR